LSTRYGRIPGRSTSAVSKNAWVAAGRSFLLRHKQKSTSLASSSGNSTLSITSSTYFHTHLHHSWKAIALFVSTYQPPAKILCLLVRLFVRLCPSLCLLLRKRSLQVAMDFTLRCNSLKCRRALNDRAVVTTCRLSLSSTEPDLITDNITAISSATTAQTA